MRYILTNEKNGENALEEKLNNEKQAHAQKKCEKETDTDNFMFLKLHLKACHTLKKIYQSD